MTVALPPPLQQNAAEFQQLLQLYRHRRPLRVLEVGVGEGGTLYHWLQNARVEATVVAIDDRHTSRSSYPEWVPVLVELVTIRGNSHHHATITQALEHGPYDWTFIDADHHEPAVREDWKIYSALTRPGGIVALHDITPTDDPTIQVDRLWRDLAEAYRTDEYAHGGQGIGVVYTDTDH